MGLVATSSGRHALVFKPNLSSNECEENNFMLLLLVFVLLFCNPLLQVRDRF